jgi:hypothetical protein
VLAVITAAVGATFLLRPDLWGSAAGDAGHPAAATQALPAQPPKPAAGAATGNVPDPVAPMGSAPLFAAPEPPPHGIPAPAVDPAAHATAPESGANGANGAGGAAGEPASGTP